MTKNDFFDASDDILEMNPNPDDFYNVLNLYQDDPLDDPEDFLEMNEIFDDLFAHEVFEDDHGIHPLEMITNDFFDDDLEDFLEMNEIFDHLFAHEVFEDFLEMKEIFDEFGYFLQKK